MIENDENADRGTNGDRLKAGHDRILEAIAVRHRKRCAIICLAAWSAIVAPATAWWAEIVFE